MKKFKRPTMISEKIFERLSLACTKAQAWCGGETNSLNTQCCDGTAKS